MSGTRAAIGSERRLGLGLVWCDYCDSAWAHLSIDARGERARVRWVRMHRDEHEGDTRATVRAV